MSKHLLSRTRDPLELIERLLNETTLTTKRITHGNIIGVGEDVLDHKKMESEEDRVRAVREAVQAAELRATRELRAALGRQKQKMEEDKRASLEKQKMYYEELSKRVAKTRDRLEEERIRELEQQFEKELSKALQKQWEECECLKVIAIQEACTALCKQLRKEFILEKEKAIASALATAREKFKKRELEVIERTRCECEEKAAAEAARVSELHLHELQSMQLKYDVLHQKYEKELAHKRRVERDFRELQTDYKRFMDCTEGRYHSDYMMLLRNHGFHLAMKRISTVTYEDVEKLQL